MLGPWVLGPARRLSHTACFPTLSPRGGQALPPSYRARPAVLSRMKPVGSVNDVALDALDLDRMKQVSVTFPVWP